MTGLERRLCAGVFLVNGDEVLLARRYELTVFAATTWGGEPRNLAPDEHDALGWFTVDALPGLPLTAPELINLVGRAVELCR